VIRRKIIKCPDCKGSGKRLWKLGKCKRCKGTGYVVELDLINRMPRENDDHD